MANPAPTDPAARDLDVLGLRFALRARHLGASWLAQVTSYGVTWAGQEAIAALPRDFLGDTMGWSAPGPTPARSLDALERRVRVAIVDALSLTASGPGGADAAGAS